MKYKKLVEFLSKVEKKDDQTNERRIITAEKIEQLKASYPNVPSDYLDYLLEVGEGSFKESQFMVYSFLGTLADFSSEHLFSRSINILIFGDNFAGDFSGFNVDNNYSVVELWHDCGEVYETNKSFKEYIEQQALMTEDGTVLAKT